MGQARRRGSYEERIAQSLEKEAAAAELRALEREKRKQEQAVIVTGKDGKRRYSRIERTMLIAALAGIGVSI